ncbi:trypsin-like serine peptidase [Ensifer aridi]|uniref:trypsin-like serine peptidase n=1 Tax=Ensifer aridi TaxID=1708715 RepID=UPI0015E280BC|nr:trypsin-like serine protease [Ensifer aridi]
MKTSRTYVGFVDDDEPCEPPGENDDSAIRGSEEAKDYLTYCSVDDEGYETTYTLDEDEWDAISERVRQEEQLNVAPFSPFEELPGANDLTRVLPPTQREYPYRRVCYLTIGGCTGAIIGERHVMTCAHCIYNRKKGKYYRKGKIYIARNGDTAPGSYHDVQEHFVTLDYKKKGLRRYDYGIKILSDNVNLTEVGRLHYRSHQPINEDETRVHIIGYPDDDRGYDPNGTERMWEGRGAARISRRDDRVLKYFIDSVGGLSGAPVLFYDDSRPYIIAIHSGYDRGDARNAGCYITDDVFIHFRKWKEDYPPISY